MKLLFLDIRHKREEVKEVLADDDLEKIVDLTLTETETIWLLDMPTVCVSNEADDASAIKEKNEKYEQVKLTYMVTIMIPLCSSMKNSRCEQFFLRQQQFCSRIMVWHCSCLSVDAMV